MLNLTCDLELVWKVQVDVEFGVEDCVGFYVEVDVEVEVDVWRVG